MKRDLEWASLAVKIEVYKEMERDWDQIKSVQNLGNQEGQKINKAAFSKNWGRVEGVEVAIVLRERTKNVRGEQQGIIQCSVQDS